MTSSLIKIEEIRGDIIKLMKEAMSEKRKSCVTWSNQADCGGETCIKILSQNDQLVTVELKSYGGCSGGVSFAIVMTIPREVIETIINENQR